MNSQRVIDGWRRSYQRMPDGTSVIVRKFAGRTRFSDRTQAGISAAGARQWPHSREVNEGVAVVGRGLGNYEIAERLGGGVAIIWWASALLYNGLGRYEEALVPAQHAGKNPDELLFSTLALVELTEAAVRSGKSELAADALDRLSQATAASATDWALGVEARSRALLAEGEAAETLYRQAIERLRRTRVRVELARAHLLYGEWLRRERRRLDAREQLRTAHAMFTEYGMEAFAERARVELDATGEHARKRTVETRDDLTPRKRRSPALRRRVPRIRKSRRSCSSARAPSTTTSARPSGSSESSPDTN
jgi:tetratricopeptide (TPR) repeat protein